MTASKSSGHESAKKSTQPAGNVEKDQELTPAERRAAEEQARFHQTKYLLKQYRRVVYAVRVSEDELNQRMEMEHGSALSTLEVNADLAGVDLSGTKLERYAQSVIRSKNMLTIVDNSLKAVKGDPERGVLLYHILYLTYFSPNKPRNRNEIIMELERLGYPMSMVTYHFYLNKAIKAIDKILWGYTARDCADIINMFLPEKPT